MDPLLTTFVNTSGILLISFIIWWFFGFKPKVEKSATSFHITVDNGVYTPAHLSAKIGKPLQLHFTRKSKSPCSATVIFHGLNISEHLPLNETKTISYTPDRIGVFEFSCQMGMYKGSLTIEK